MCATLEPGPKIASVVAHPMLDINLLVTDLRHPNKKFIATASKPLIERDPVLFWQCLSAILFVAVLIVLALLVMHYGKH